MEMTKNPLQWIAINDDVNAEFDFWKRRLLVSVWTATAFAVATGMAIALWPPGSGSEQLRRFALDVWPMFVEAAFWLGFLFGLLWSAALRLGSGLSGILPWVPSHQISRTEATTRMLAQCAGGLGLAGVFLLITQPFALQLHASVPNLPATLILLMKVCFGLAGVLAVLAVGVRVRTGASPHLPISHE
jgi:hypothetical protein